jgi:hypothetical protein
VSSQSLCWTTAEVKLEMFQVVSNYFICTHSIPKFLLQARQSGHDQTSGFCVRSMLELLLMNKHIYSINNLTRLTQIKVRQIM